MTAAPFDIAIASSGWIEIRQVNECLAFTRVWFSSAAAFDS